MEDDDRGGGESLMKSANGHSRVTNDGVNNKIANGKRNHEEDDSISSAYKKRRLDDATNNSVSNGAASSTKSGGSAAPRHPEGNSDEGGPTKRRSQRQREVATYNEHSHSDDEVGDVPVKEIHMSRKEREEEERIRKLDATTLGLLRDVLNDQTSHSHLNDDEMMHFLARVDREARHLSHLQGGSHPEDTDGSLIEELVAEAEDTALGREVLHRAISTVNKNHTGSADRRTVEWVRRAAGFGKSKMENFVRENAEAGRITKGHSKPGRYTRNMARNTREERREKGLGILLSAVDDLEAVLGPYPAYKPKKRRRVPSDKMAVNASASADMEEPQQTPKVNNRKKPLENKRKNEGKAASRSSRDAVARTNVDEILEQGREPVKVKPSWDSVRLPQDNVIETFELPACKHEKSVYAKKSLRLVKSMSEPHLLWSRYEFFYSDVDRAWYAAIVIRTACKTISILTFAYYSGLVETNLFTKQPVWGSGLGLF